MPLSIARLLLGFAMAAAVGASLRPRRARLRDNLSPGQLSLSAALGMAAVVPVLVAAGIPGLPVFGWWTVAVELAIAAVAWRLTARRPEEEARPEPESRDRLSRVSALLPLAALGVFAWKVALAPIWTWDHYLVWGMKARRIADGNLLDLRFLQPLPFARANADYPLGLPVAWRVLTLGREPQLLDFKVCHVLFGALAVALVYRSLREQGVPVLWSNAVAAFVALSPLYWDTENVGIAEMPLCVMSLAALTLVLRQADLPGRTAWLPGLALGFLPWIKKEGLWLAILLFGAGWLVSRARPGFRAVRLLPSAAAMTLLAGGALLVERLLLPAGEPFLGGDWPRRVAARAPHILVLLEALGEELTAPDWLGFWLVVPAALLVAAWRRDRLALAIFAVVFGQAALYAFTYLATYLNPLAHMESSFFRLMGALLPLAAAGIGVLLRKPYAAERGAIRMTRESVPASGPRESPHSPESPRDLP